ncbi:hypothetical protein LSAT2_026968, partial [Lamellibrachia satsuma]
MLGNPWDVSIGGIREPLDNSLPRNVYKKTHLPGFRPINQPLQIRLEGFCIFSAADTSVYNAVICQESDVRGSALYYVI